MKKGKKSENLETVDTYTHRCLIKKKIKKVSQE